MRLLQAESAGLEVSGLYETAPKGFRGQPPFLNAACRLWTRPGPLRAASAPPTGPVSPREPACVRQWAPYTGHRHTGLRVAGAQSAGARHTSPSHDGAGVRPGAAGGDSASAPASGPEGDGPLAAAAPARGLRCERRSVWITASGHALIAKCSVLYIHGETRPRAPTHR